MTLPILATHAGMQGAHTVMIAVPTPGTTTADLSQSLAVMISRADIRARDLLHHTPRVTRVLPIVLERPLVKGAHMLDLAQPRLMRVVIVSFVAHPTTPPQNASTLTAFTIL